MAYHLYWNRTTRITRVFRTTWNYVARIRSLVPRPPPRLIDVGEIKSPRENDLLPATDDVMFQLGARQLILWCLIKTGRRVPAAAAAALAPHRRPGAANFHGSWSFFRAPVYETNQLTAADDGRTTKRRRNFFARRRGWGYYAGSTADRRKGPHVFVCVYVCVRAQEGAGVAELNAWLIPRINYPGYRWTSWFIWYLLAGERN